MVRISQHQWAPHSLHVRVYCHNSPSLSRQHRESVLAQVSRMLRLSEDEERAVREFRNMYNNEKKKKKKKKESSFVGRVFRSPTLFEDMVKCMLLRNCQWSRTLSMARALCELSWNCSLNHPVCYLWQILQLLLQVPTLIPQNPIRTSSFPTHPYHKESKVSTNFTNSGSIKADCVPADIVRDDDDYSCLNCKTCQAADEPHNIASDYDTIGNFPSPTELANLDEGFLASRCNLGYRASRILKLARDIVEGRIQLTQLEEASKGASFAKSSNYDKLAKQLKEIDGFGTFTCANVLMCMGYYHVIPTDSETIRHLKKVHARNSTVQTIQRDIDRVYEKHYLPSKLSTLK
ncbi:hypothetical protein ACB092_09G207700 [Castanea dentata]